MTGVLRCAALPRAVVLVAVALVTLVAPVSISAASIDPIDQAPATPRFGQPETGLRFTDTTTFVPADGTFSFTVDASKLRLTDELAWTVHSLVPNETDAIAAALSDEPGPPLRAEERATIAELDLSATEPTEPTDADRTTVSIPIRSQSTGSERVYLPDAGIYPVSVRLQRGDETIDDTVLPLIRLSEDPTGAGRFVHLTTTVAEDPALGLDGSAEPSADDLSVIAALTDHLATLPDPGENEPAISIAMPTELIDTLARSDDPDEVELVTRLAEVADRATWLAAPYVPLDLGGWAAADVARNPALTLSYDTAARRSSELLGVQLNTQLVPPDPTIAAPTVGFLADRGATSMLLDPTTKGVNDLPTTAFTLAGSWAPPETRPARESERPGDRETPTSPSTLPALAVTDFSASIIDKGAPIEADTVARQLALLSAAPLADFGRGPDVPEGSDQQPAETVAALALPRTLTNDALTSLIGSLDAADGVLTPIGANAITAALTKTQAARTGPEVALGSAASVQLGPVELATYRAQQSINAAAGLDAADPTLVLAQRQALVAPHRALSAEEGQAYALSARGAAQAMLNSISLGDISAITLAARQSKVPFRFRNTLDTEVTVLLRVRSDRLRLTDAGGSDQIELVVPPGRSTSEVSVEVITSGVFTVDADVLTPTGDELIERQSFQVRSRAFSGVGVALSVASLLVLGLWWGRTVRAKRRADVA